MLESAKIAGFLITSHIGNSRHCGTRNYYAGAYWEKHCIEAHHPNVTYVPDVESIEGGVVGCMTAEYSHLGLIQPTRCAGIAQRLLSVAGCGGSEITFLGPNVDCGLYDPWKRLTAHKPVAEFFCRQRDPASIKMTKVPQSLFAKRTIPRKGVSGKVER